MKGDLGRILLEAVVLAVFGAMLGLSINYRLVLGALEGKESAAPASPALPERLYPAPAGLAETREILAGGGTAVDARDAEDFRQGHIPGAISLPLGEADKALPAFGKAVSPQKTLVVYCSGYGCTDSFDLAVRLMGAGYRDVRVFEGGFPAWHDAGLSVAKGEK